MGWTTSYSQTTGLISLENNGIFPDVTYDVWRATAQKSNQDMMAVTLNFGDLLDFNQNGQTDPEEELVRLGVDLEIGFEGYMNVLNSFWSDLPRFSLSEQLSALSDSHQLQLTSLSESTVSLEHSTQFGVRYVLQSCSNLSFEGVDLWESEPFWGTGELKTHTLPREANKHFYRLKLE